MKPNTRNSLTVVASLLMLLALPRNAFSATNHVTACATAITKAGLWVVDNDLTCSGNAINVQVSNVTLKLQGHTITGPGTTVNGYGILVASSSIVSVKNVTILGPGKITAYVTGVNFAGTVGGGATDLQLTGNIYGLYLGSDNTGVYSSGLLISQNEITSNIDGIFCEIALKTSIVGNNVTSNTQNGIYLVQGTGNSIVGNVANNNFTNGIEIGLSNGTGANGNTFEGNITDSNQNAGINVISPATGNHFTGNVASANGVLDISESNAACATETYKNDVFGTANLTCVK